MTFLNPLLLLGLAAAAIPVILHLLNLRKLRTVDFSTLAFLKELQQSRIRRLKLRQILLLLLRTLMVVFIVLAFARPALRGSLPAGFGTSAGSSVAIVLDDSQSMLAEDEEGERYAQAKKAVHHVLSLLKEGDAAWLVRLSDLPAITVDPPTHDVQSLAATIDRSQPSPVRRPLGDGLAAAIRLMDRSRDVNREIYLVSDFQKTALAAGPAPGAGENPGPGSDPGPSGQPGPEGRVGPAGRLGPADRIGPAIPPDPRVRVFTVEIGGGDVPNAAVDSVAVLSRIFEKNRPVEVLAGIRNHGPAVLRDAVVSVFTGGTRVAQSNVTVEPGAAGTITLTVVPRAAGPVDGYVALEDDELSPDNHRYFTFTVPGRIRVLAASPSAEAARFVVSALRAGSSGQGESAMAIDQASPSALSRANLREYDAVVLCGVPSLDQATADRIRSFVTAGGGLVLFPGNEMDASNYNARLLEPMNLPEIRGVTGTPGGVPTAGGTDGAGGSVSGTGLYFREIDFDHPLFSTIFENDGREREPRRLSPRIDRSLILRATPRSRSVITLSNGGGFFMEQPVGSGRAAIFSCAADLSWGDFPVKGLFAPLVYRTVVYLASGSDRLEQYSVGSEATVTVRQQGPADPGARYAVQLPDSLEEIVVPAPSGAGLTFRHPRLPLPGHYRITAGTKVLSIFPANLDPAESNLAKAEAEDVARFLRDFGLTDEQVKPLAGGDELPARIAEARFGMELWKYCVALALLFAMVEMAVNRHAGGEKTADA